MVAGIPDEKYWELTLEEVRAVLELRAREQAALARAADLRAGLVAATLVNIFRKKGKKPVQPTDFIRGPRKPMSPEAARSFMNRWARGINSDVGKKRPLQEDNA
jgi:hypothetical protein